ncbi:MAG: HAMP domain-containing protein [Gammaproteobacteria bacterium]|nr:HAMP domain-containing protein [Gammaproteobacteria bacterium]
MRIRTQIFSWVFLATIVPLTALALSATYYIEYDYERGVRDAVATSLETLTGELERHLQSNRDLAMGLTRAAPVQDFLPVMAELEKGDIDPMLNVDRSRITHYFEGFQTILPGMYIMRLMDRYGNSFIKVDDNKVSAPIYEGVNGIMYAEQEADGPRFMSRLKKLPRGEVSMTVLAQNEQQSDYMSILPLLDYIVPLYDGDNLVGALSLTLFGETIDGILDNAPRLYKGKLFLTENNSDNKLRYGLLLYDDQQEIRLSQIRGVVRNFQGVYGEKLLLAITDNQKGYYPMAKQTLYFNEFYPYPNSLTSWIIGLRIDNDQIVEPFQQIRWVIWSVAAIALIISLLLGNIGVRIIARPLAALSRNLLSYARGEQVQRVSTDAAVDEIRDLEIAFNTMADSLDKTSEERDRATHMLLQSAKLASIGQMAAGIGHEINNPLNNILSFAKLIERQLGPDDARSLQDLKSLKEEALRASEIIRGILNFARQVTPHYVPFAIRQWLLDTFALVQQSAKSKGVTLSHDCPEDVVIEGDRGQLQQALINLLINAIQASANGDEVHVIVQVDSEEVSISVIDQGTGIAADDLDLVYDPFFTTKPEGEGSGLGLSISLGIVERHGGKLVLSNNPDRGTTATMVIPRVPEETQHE